MKYISLRLTFALSTFFIDILLTAFWAFVYYPKAVIPPPIVVVSDNTIKHQEINQLEKPEINENGIDIEYSWSLMGVESLDGDFYVKNNTGETIKYLANDFGQNSPFWIKQNGIVKEVRQSYDVSDAVDVVKEQELKPNESTIFSIPVPQNEKPFEAGFSFQIGSERREKIIWVKIEKQLKSHGLSCNEKIMKAGGVLSKTCITEMPNPN